MKRRVVILALLLYAVAPRGYAAEPSTPTSEIEAFDAALLSAMKLPQGRDAALSPILERTFNFSVMAQFLVGVPWDTMPDGDHTALVVALRRYTAARLAVRFDHFADQKFVVDPVARERGSDRLVKTQFIAPGADPVQIDYRMREYAGLWKVIDVYSDGVSLLSAQRADVASTLEAGGPVALAAKLQQAADQLR